MSAYEFEVGDYIRFTRIVQAKREGGLRTDYGTGRAVAIPMIPEQVMQQPGEAQITSISKTTKKIDGVKYQTARAIAGKPLGTVTVILDDAVLVGKQQGLFDLDSVPSGGSSMYDNDLGHA